MAYKTHDATTYDEIMYVMHLRTLLRFVLLC